MQKIPVLQFVKVPLMTTPEQLQLSAERLSDANAPRRQPNCYAVQSQIDPANSWRQNPLINRLAEQQLGKGDGRITTIRK